MEDELVRLKLKLKSKKIVCAFCGEGQVFQDDPKQMMADHITICEKHPMRIVVLENMRLKESLEFYAQRCDTADSLLAAFEEKQRMAEALRKIVELENNGESLEQGDYGRSDMINIARKALEET